MRKQKQAKKTHPDLLLHHLLHLHNLQLDKIMKNSLSLIKLTNNNKSSNNRIIKQKHKHKISRNCSNKNNKQNKQLMRMIIIMMMKRKKMLLGLLLYLITGVKGKQQLTLIDVAIVMIISITADIQKMNLLMSLMILEMQLLQCFQMLQ